MKGVFKTLLKDALAFVLRIVNQITGYVKRASAKCRRRAANTLWYK